MHRRTHTLLACAAACAALSLTRAAAAHGILGDRFFPPTITIDDPFPVDEFAFPTVSLVKNAGGPGGQGNFETDAGFEFDKEIFPRFAIGISDTYFRQKPDRGPSIEGWGNIVLTAKYEIWANAEHEALVSVGLQGEIGGSGRHDVADSFSTVTPKVFFAKGFGDLPDELDSLQPFAFSGEFTQSFPLSSDVPNFFGWGFAIEYSLPYLQQHVRDIGLRAPFSQMVPLVEFSFQTAENRAQGGLTTGTVNPGVLWDTAYFQLGVEANIPINSRSGAHVGVTIQAWIFIDDIFPRTFGHPLFGG